MDIDVLFPREGPCDLTDLRCDAALSREAVVQAVGGGVSLWLLGAAERGDRHLDSAWMPVLAGLYAVSVDVLQAAQRRSFGEPDPVPAEAVGLPMLTLQLRARVVERFPDGEPSSGDIAAAVNEAVGTDVVRGDQVDAILRGIPADRVFGGAQGARSVAITGLAHYFGVSELDLDGLGAERRVVADLRYLANRYNVAFTDRGDGGGVSREMVALLSDLVNRELTGPPYP
ncbi:hypothetical protein ACFY2N_34085 [Streptomyces rubiginosohelvolus]|uniref:hypothetical protein n=1 Tax=Streptomyces rubiginosohelvolus TaxID=67362 RepID=UPI0036CD8B23